MGLDMFVREIRSWEKQELSRFAQAILNTIPKSFNVNNPDPDVEENFNIDSFLAKHPTIPVPYKLGEELCYWRKHPDVHGWMKNLFFDKGGITTSDFNHDTIFLTREDVSNLEKAIQQKELPSTSGFFFGSSYGDDKEWEEYRNEQDRICIEKMFKALDNGSVIYYTSSW